MTDINMIKRGIQILYRTNPNIHICVSLNRPKIHIENHEARIKAIYPNVFEIESQGRHYTAQYVDILTKNLQIVELGQIVSAM